MIQSISALIDQYQQIYVSCHKLLPEEAEQVLSFAKVSILSLPMPIGSEPLFIGDIDLSKHSVSYNLRRCGRLCKEHSTALLAKFAAFIARAAFDHDFGGGKEESSS